VTVALNEAFYLLCGKGEVFYEYTFALHHQQSEKDKQNVDIAPLENISTDTHVHASIVIAFHQTFHTQSR